MSLINQMLQELDARRSEATGTSTYGQQVRVVSDRPRLRKIHIRPAWWGGVAVAGLVAGIAIWFWLRPTTPSPVPSVPVPVASATAKPAAAELAPVPVPALQALAVNLPLKLDTGLTTAQSNSTLSTGAPSQARPDAASITVPPAASPRVDAPGVGGGPSAGNGGVKSNRPAPAVGKEPANAAGNVNSGSSPDPRKENGQAFAARRADPPVMPEIEKVIPAEKSLVKQASSKVADLIRTPATGKQFKELTSQQRADNEYGQGVLSMQQGKTSEAVASFEQALDFDPANAAARQALVGLLLESRQRDAAIRRARDGLTIDAAQPPLAMILARMLLEKGDLEYAIEVLERTLPYAVDQAEYQAFLAALLQRGERHKEAVEHYLLAVQRAPQNGVWWMGMGISLHAERRRTEAQEAFKRAKATGALSPQLQEYVDAQMNLLQSR